MNDKKLKEMWNKAEYFMGTANYESSTIERFLSNRSGSIAQKFRNMMQLDIGFKIAILLALVLDVILYFNVQPLVATICALAAVLILPLIWFERSILNKFSQISDSSKNTKEKLSEMITFLKRQSFATLLATASTYLFGFNGGILLYFFAEYGQLRRMGSLDIFVFPAICLIGIVITVAQNNTIIKYQIKHIELCLSDLNEDILPVVSRNIEEQQKRDRTMNVLVGAVVLLAFLVLVFVLKELGM